MGAAAIPLAVTAIGYQIYSSDQQQKMQKKALEAQANKPLPVATPSPTMADRSPLIAEQSRQRKLASLQYGFASTISKSRLNTPANPAADLTPLKTRLGQ